MIVWAIWGLTHLLINVTSANSKVILHQQNMGLLVQTAAIMILKQLMWSNEPVAIWEIRKRVQWLMVVIRKFLRV